MTPQTLNNDLVSENCDVQDIVLLVIGITAVQIATPLLIFSTTQMRPTERLEVMRITKSSVS
jgi:hypothetical protein